MKNFQTRALLLLLISVFLMACQSSTAVDEADNTDKNTYDNTNSLEILSPSSGSEFTIGDDILVEVKTENIDTVAFLVNFLVVATSTTKPHSAIISTSAYSEGFLTITAQDAGTFGLGAKDTLAVKLKAANVNDTINNNLLDINGNWSLSSRKVYAIYTMEETPILNDTTISNYSSDVEIMQISDSNNTINWSKNDSITNKLSTSFTEINNYTISQTEIEELLKLQSMTIDTTFDSTATSIDTIIDTTIADSVIINNITDSDLSSIPTLKQDKLNIINNMSFTVNATYFYSGAFSPTVNMTMDLTVENTYKSYLNSAFPPTNWPATIKEVSLNPFSIFE